MLDVGVIKRIFSMSDVSVSGPAASNSVAIRLIIPSKNSFLLIVSLEIASIEPEVLPVPANAT